MSTIPVPSAPLRRLALLCAAFALTIVSCGREVTAPQGARARVAQFAWVPVFPQVLTQTSGNAGTLVPFDRVHIVLHRTDGSVALDTTVVFPPGADAVPVSLTVLLSPTAPATGEVLSLTLNYVNAAGQTVFTGGPVAVTATPSGGSPPPSVEIPVRYSGPGSTAAGVQISPHSLTLFDGDPFTFTAQALDASGAVLAGTPIVWTALDPSIAVLASTTSGAGTALAVRGTGRIVAQLLTGPADTARVTVTLRARNLASAGGDAQTGLVGHVLSQPIAVRATAVDGVGVGGVSVQFAASVGGGSVLPATVTTDATGLAQATWTLGSAVGTQQATATAAGLTGSPVTFSANGKPAAPVKLVFSTQPPTPVASGATIGPVTVTALDAQGATATSFTGVVNIALSATAPSGPLLGTLSATAVAGVATFSDLHINVAATGYTFDASAAGLAGATSNPFNVTVGPATRLEFGAYPTALGSQVGVAFNPITVIARDAGGNIATGFSGVVTLALPTGNQVPLLGTLSATAVNGVATFTGIGINVLGNYQLVARSTGFADVTGRTFVVSVGPPASIALMRGGTQSAPAGTLLDTIVVAVVDAGGDQIPGVTVTFAVMTGGGSVSVSSVVTDARGFARTRWTLGSKVGTQTIAASSIGLPTLTISATAISGPVGTMAVFGGNNQFTTANTAVLTPPSVIVKDGTGNPVSGVAVTFTPGAGSSITGSATVTTGTNGVAAVGGWTLGASGSFTLTAAAPGYTSLVFTATVNTVPMSVTSTEKLPNGTQQFSVVGGNVGDSYTWTVNGIVGGNATFGTITSTGFYTAPSTVPTPSTFAVCAQSVQTPANKGCISVTITVTPTAGGEMIVINDINWADNSIGLVKSGGSYVNPGNAQFVRNLVDFTPAGVRSAATKVMLLADGGSGTAYMFGGGWSEVGNIIAGEGFTPYNSTLHSDLITIPLDVKVVILMMPSMSFSVSEINGLKTFASQGGRIFYVGENGYFYSYGLPIENALLVNMGAQMTNTGSCDAYPWSFGVGNVNSIPDQLTAGIIATGSGSFFMACASRINLGPNDFAFMRDAVSNVVLGAIAKIDYTLLPVTALLAPPRVLGGPATAQLQKAGETLIPKAGTALGIPRWTSSGPLPRQ